TLGARGENVRVDRPVRSASAQWEFVMVTRYHESRRRRLREVRAFEPREVLRSKRCQVVSAPARRGKQSSGRNARVGQILGVACLWVLHAQAEQSARSLATERMASYGDTAHVEASGELGDGGGQVLEVVEHSFGILDAEAPEPRLARVVLR